MLTKFCVVFSIAASLWITSNAGSSGDEKNNGEEELNPRALEALHYELNFDVKFPSSNKLYSGRTVIRLKCITPTTYVILNVKEIIIDKDYTKVQKEIIPDSPEKAVSYKDVGGGKQSVKKTKEWHIIKLNEELKENDIVRVTLEYSKILLLTDFDAAFVKYSYVTQTTDGEKSVKWLAVTRSGAVNARRLYPCLDEPDSKATFNVKVYRDQDYRSLSNTFVEDEDTKSFDSRNWAVDVYEETTSLSTFSIGFLIGDFKSKENIDNVTGRAIRIWAQETVLDKMDFASDTAVLVFQFYTSYFTGAIGIRRPDIAALPNYNHIDKWRYGLMTLNESLIAIQDPSNEIRKIEVALQICDLFCHQYFGPQTTLQKWRENWVNMGFALYFRIPCLAKIFPGKETSVVNIHLVESFMRALSVEAELKSRQVFLSDDSIDLVTLFDDSVLAETAYLVVRMMSFFLGHNTLYESVKKYIIDYRFKVLDLDKLWTMFPLGEENSKLLKSDKPSMLKDIMDSWTSKAGHAYIKLTRNEKTVTIEQILPAAGSEGANNPRIIPLNFATKSQLMAGSNQEAKAKFWLQSEPLEIQVNNDEWIIHDSRLNVLCRTEYDSRSLDLLEGTLLNTITNEYKIIPVLTRANFVFDLFALAETNKISYERVFRTMTYLSHEDSHLPFIVAVNEFNKIRFGLFRTEVFAIFERYVQQILHPIFSGKLFEKVEELSQDDYETYNFKQTITKASCIYGVDDCIAQSARLYDSWQTAEQPEINNPIPQVLRSAIYCRVIQDHGDEIWNLLWVLYDKENPGKNDDILNSLACIADEYKLYEFLTWSIDAEKIAPQDRLTVFKSVGFNMRGYDVMKKFMRENFHQLIKIHAKDRSKVYYYWEILYEITYKQNELQQLEDLILGIGVKLELPKFETRLADSRWKAKKNIAWLERNRHDFVLFLQKAIYSMPPLPKKKSLGKPSELKVASSEGVQIAEGLHRRKNNVSVDVSNTL